MKLVAMFVNSAKKHPLATLGLAIAVLLTRSSPIPLMGPGSGVGYVETPNEDGTWTRRYDNGTTMTFRPK